MEDGLNCGLQKKRQLKISDGLEAIFRDFYWFPKRGESGKKKRQETSNSSLAFENLNLYFSDGTDAGTRPPVASF